MAQGNALGCDQKKISSPERAIEITFSQTICYYKLILTLRFNRCNNEKSIMVFKTERMVQKCFHRYFRAYIHLFLTIYPLYNPHRRGKMVNHN